MGGGRGGAMGGGRGGHAAIGGTAAVAIGGGGGTSCQQGASATIGSGATPWGALQFPGEPTPAATNSACSIAVPAANCCIPMLALRLLLLRLPLAGFDWRMLPALITIPSGALQFLREPYNH